ncbi:MAG: hypothetical protein SWZ49_28160 [Cyanobacteriota bacterium]|nr:hypothetical protein [Cyanobacteriota bacterium]
MLKVIFLSRLPVKIFEYYPFRKAGLGNILIAGRIIGGVTSKLTSLDLGSYF